MKIIQCNSYLINGDRRRRLIAGTLTFISINNIIIKCQILKNSQAAI